jgi:arabinose-5-phosphate isomerase
MTLQVVALESSSRSTSDQRSSSEQSVLAEARHSLSSQAQALIRAAAGLDDAFVRALQLIVDCSGRVVVCGIGKSGLIARKLVATFNCSGTRSFFLHPAEASHGDFGMLERSDVVVLISNSGGTEEIVRVLPHFNELGVTLIALVGKRHSALGRAAHVVIETGVEQESCPHDFVPTTSALVTMALGDALATAAMRARKITADDLLRWHPGGTLGKRRNGSVRDAMQRERLPLVAPDMPLAGALLTMTAGRLGLVIAVGEAGEPLGIVTDGDLRRTLVGTGTAFAGLQVADVMTANPVTIHQDSSLREARERMRLRRIKALVVVGDDNRVTGVIEVFDSP